mgnify:CR=1 FL=1
MDISLVPKASVEGAAKTVGPNDHGGPLTPQEEIIGPMGHVVQSKYYHYPSKYLEPKAVSL